MQTLSIDIETYSDRSLKDVGMYKYAASPNFRLLLFGYSVDGASAKVLDVANGGTLPADVRRALYDPEVIKHAFNAQFERVCLTAYARQACPHLLEELELSLLAPSAWRCTMVQASYWGIAGGLAQVGAFLDVEVQKDAAGTRLINKFSKPNKQGEQPACEGEDWERFISYCVRDVDSEVAIAEALAQPLPPHEQKLYELDQLINDRGIKVDRRLAHNAVVMANEDAAAAFGKMRDLTRLDNPNSVIQLKSWLASKGLHMSTLGREVVEDVLQGDLPADVRQVLQLRLASAKATNKKYIVAANASGDDNRLRGSFQYYGAATGRWCLTGDHEVLTAYGWQRFDEWQGGLIACWQPYGEQIAFAKAKALSFDYQGELIHLKGERIDQLSTPDHAMYIENVRSGERKPCLVSDLPSRFGFPINGHRTVSTRFNSDALRVLVMTQADGHYTKENALQFHFRKVRKIERCKRLLRRAGIVHVVTQHKDAVRIKVALREQPFYLAMFRDKTFGGWLFDTDPSAFFDELEHWDSYTHSENSYQYSTTNKTNADLVQAFAHMSGLTATVNIKVRKNKNWNTAYCVNLWRRAKTFHQYRTDKETQEHNGRVYCAETPTGYFLVRRNGRVWVTGNSGRLMQLQNLARGELSGNDQDVARELVRAGDIGGLDTLYGNVADTLKQLVRTTLVPEEGFTFAVSDFSAIEARVLAWLAGEKWVLDVFKTTGKVYEATAARMFHVDMKDVTKELRQRGKVTTLALGYQGGTAALERMGALRMGVPEKELSRLVGMWRRTNPRIVGLWGEVEEAVHAVATGVRRRVEVAGGRVVVLRTSFGVLIKLPAGRVLTYRGMRADRVTGKLHYDTTRGITETYGGKLVENITQAVARDVLADAMLRLFEAGYSIVAHVHDEVVIEVPTEAGEGALEKINEIMAITPDWAEGLPLDAEGYCCTYYHK